MLLYDAGRPNPRAVRMFVIEKGISIPAQDIDVDGGENRRPPYTDANPAGQVPALRLDDGTCLAETGAIFQYLDEVFSERSLIGSTPASRAETRMWQRQLSSASPNIFMRHSTMAKRPKCIGPGCESCLTLCSD